MMWMKARFMEGPSDGVDVFAVERRFVMGYVEGLDEFKLEAKFLVRETEASSMKRSSVVPERGTPTITGIGGSSVVTRSPARRNLDSASVGHGPRHPARPVPPKLFDFLQEISNFSWQNRFFYDAWCEGGGFRRQ
jgi:hypothetical protein